MTDTPDDAIEEAVLLLRNVAMRSDDPDDDSVLAEAQRVISDAHDALEEVACLLTGMDNQLDANEMLAMGYTQTMTGHWYRLHPDHDNVLELY